MISVGSSAMGQLPASVDPARYWLLADPCWQQGAMQGPCAIAETSPGFSAISEAASRGEQERLDLWVARQCQSGAAVYVSEPYQEGGNLLVDLFVAAEPLSPSVAQGRTPPLRAADCASLTIGPPSSSADLELLASACLKAADTGEPVELPRRVRDPQTGRAGSRLRYDPVAGRCELEPSGSLSAPLATIAGVALALLVGKTLIDRRAR
jgi:hypothetical protein